MGVPAAAARSWRLHALCARSLSAVSVRRNLNAQATTEAGKLKSKDDLPGPSLSTTLYWLFVKGYAENSHLLQVQTQIASEYTWFKKISKLFKNVVSDLILVGCYL